MRVYGPNSTKSGQFKVDTELNKRSNNFKEMNSELKIAGDL